MDFPSLPGFSRGAQNPPASQQDSGEERGGPLAPVTTFIKQSERVLNVTHKPGKFEFRQIAYITAIGMAVIGGIGFALSMFFHLARGTL